MFKEPVAQVSRHLEHLSADVGKLVNRRVHRGNIHKLDTDAVEDLVHLLVDVLQWRTRDQFLISVLRSQSTHGNLKRILVLLAHFIYAILRCGRFVLLNDFNLYLRHYQAFIAVVHLNFVEPVV